MKKISDSIFTRSLRKKTPNFPEVPYHLQEKTPFFPEVPAKKENAYNKEETLYMNSIFTRS